MMNYLKSTINLKHCEYLIQNNHFIINYSKIHGRPLWSAYSVNRAMLNNLKGGRRKFILDVTLSNNNIYQLHPKSNIFNNWTRGHLCPSLIMSHDKTLGGSWHSTYKMSNIVPQDKNFNTQAWNNLEINTLKLIKSNDFITTIITGASDLSDARQKYVWIDKKNNFKYIVPNAIYQIIITPYEIKCYLGFNNNDKIIPIKFNLLKLLVNLHEI